MTLGFNYYHACAVNLADYTNMGKGGTGRSGSGGSGAASRHFGMGWRTLQPSASPRGYLGELQVHFLQDVIRTIAEAPITLRGSAKRRCFYEPRRPAPSGDGPAPAKPPGLGLLINRMDLNVSADVLELYHDAQVRWCADYWGGTAPGGGQPIVFDVVCRHPLPSVCVHLLLYAEGLLC